MLPFLLAFLIPLLYHVFLCILELELEQAQME